jgi:chemotaxis protein methyltransferase CheR
MNRRVFEEFRELAYREAGIAMKDTKEALLSARIAKRVRVLSLGSESEYLAYLQADTGGTEMRHFLDAISTNFTSFFREPDHFERLREEVASWVRRGTRNLRVWCAASSTGEEPYTLAMTLAETLSGTATEFRILATDISVRALEQASRARYEKNRLAPVPPALRARYFVPDAAPIGAEPSYTVAPNLRERVMFKRLNLATPPFPMRGDMDVVFCRNVMIYFDAPVRQRLIAEIERLLKPGGLFVVAHSETLGGSRRGMTPVSASVYRKAAP